MPEPTTARTIVLLRHAKAASDEATDSTDDIDRQLTDRGRADASAAGSWFARWGLSVDLVLCSPAVRAQQTWQLASAGGATAARVEQEPRVYEASVDELMEVLRALSPAARTVLVVGHAPGIPALAETLADSARSDADALAAVGRKFGTTGLARLDYSGEWADLDAGGAALVEFVTPRA